MIAMALTCSPSLIIADEPTTALDVMVQAQVLSLLNELQHELGLAMLFITHDLSVLVEISGRLAIMYAGKIVEQGPSISVFENPAHPYTEALAAAFPAIGDQRFRKAPSGLGGDPPQPDAVPTGCSFHPRCPYAFDACASTVPDLFVSGEGRRIRVPARPQRGADRPMTTRSGTAPVLEVENLFVSFQGRVGFGAGLAGKKGAIAKAVDGVDLELRRGEVLALAGESGCGKTTLARTIMGLERPQQGEIRFEGEPLGKSSRILREYRRRVQIVFQDPTAALNPRQTIYESVAEGLRIHGITSQDGLTEEKLVARALARSGLRPPERFFLVYPHELSGGQRQRVVIAGALVLEPEIIVADEPVSSLDASVRGEILKLLLGLRDDFGIAMLVVTHDLGLAWTIADRVAVMYLGRIVEIGPTEEVLTKPLHPYTKALLEVVPEAGGLSRPILSGEAPDPTQIPEGCRFHPRCPEVVSGAAASAGVEARCRGEDLGLTELAPEHFAACHLAAARRGDVVPSTTT